MTSLEKCAFTLAKDSKTLPSSVSELACWFKSATRCRVLTREQNAVRLVLKSPLWFEAMASA